MFWYINRSDVLRVFVCLLIFNSRQGLCFKMLARATYSQNSNPTFREEEMVWIFIGSVGASNKLVFPVNEGKHWHWLHLETVVYRIYFAHLRCLRGDQCWSILRLRTRNPSWETRSKARARRLLWLAGEGRLLQNMGSLESAGLLSFLRNRFSHNLPVSAAAWRWE